MKYNKCTLLQVAYAHHWHMKITCVPPTYRTLMLKYKTTYALILGTLCLKYKRPMQKHVTLIYLNLDELHPMCQNIFIRPQRFTFGNDVFTHLCGSYLSHNHSFPKANFTHLFSIISCWLEYPSGKPCLLFPFVFIYDPLSDCPPLLIFP